MNGERIYDGAWLRELSPQLSPSEYPGAQRLTFRCPLCLQRPIVVNIWDGPSKRLEYEPGKFINLHHAEQGPQKDWNTLTITPSIDDSHGKPADDGCMGWHGFVTKGHAR